MLSHILIRVMCYSMFCMCTYCPTMSQIRCTCLDSGSSLITFSSVLRAHSHLTWLETLQRISNGSSISQEAFRRAFKILGGYLYMKQLLVLSHTPQKISLNCKEAYKIPPVQEMASSVIVTSCFCSVRDIPYRLYVLVGLFIGSQDQVLNTSSKIWSDFSTHPPLKICRGEHPLGILALMRFVDRFSYSWLHTRLHDPGICSSTKSTLLHAVAQCKMLLFCAKTVMIVLPSLNCPAYLAGNMNLIAGLLQISAGRYQNCFAYRDTLPTYHDIVTKITNGYSKCKAHTAPKKWKQRVQSSYVNVYSGQCQSREPAPFHSAAPIAFSILACRH